MLGLFMCVAAAYAEDIVTEPILTFTGHTGEVRSVAFSPDGTKVLTGSYDQTARLWDAATGAQIPTFNVRTGYIRSVAYSPDGTKVLTGGLDNGADQWDAATGAQIPTNFNVQPYNVNVNSVAYSPDGTKVLIGRYDLTPTLWDAATGAQIRSFLGHTWIVTSVAYSPDGTKVLTGSEDATARLWDAATGAQIRIFNVQPYSVTSVAYSPDGTKVLTGSKDGTARLWDAATGAQIRTFNVFTWSGVPVAYSPDGMTVLTGGANSTAQLWDAATGARIRRFQAHTKTVTSVAYSPDGTKVLTGSEDATARLWAAGPVLFLRSTPIAGVPITGDVAGVTDFSTSLSQMSQGVMLTAALLVVKDTVRYDFARWQIDGEQQPLGQLSVQFTVDASMTATAVYEIHTHTLTVASEPFGGLDIMGDYPGNTPYCATGTDQEAVHLALDSPVNIMHGGSSYNFLYWLIDGVPQPRGCTSVDILMDADRTATAVYNLFADANGDCAVNVLDLIFVRNRLGANPNTGDNWRADIVTGDGAINVLDLIAVRNYLGSKCGE